MLHGDVGVNVDGADIPADKVVIAMGPWSGDAAKWLPNVPSISGQKAHSILVRPTEEIGAECLFTQFQNSSGESALWCSKVPSKSLLGPSCDTDSYALLQKRAEDGQGPTEGLKQTLAIV